MMLSFYNNPEKLLLDTGFIDREGKFHPCFSYEHFSYAEFVLTSMGVQSDNPVDYLLKDLGWIQIQGDYLLTDKVRFQLFKKPSQDQIQFINKYIETHEESIQYQYLREDLSNYISLDFCLGENDAFH